MNKREKVFNMFGGRCAYCGCELDFNNFHIDHKVPRSVMKPGTNDINNYFPSCPDCNLFKNDLSIEGFRDKIKNSIHKTIQGRIVSKYFHADDQDITFYFEKENGYGNL